MTDMNHAGTDPNHAGESAAAGPLILHVVPGFGPGGAQSRISVLLNRLGCAFRHVIVSLSGDVRASERIDASVDVRCVKCPVSGNPLRAVGEFANLLRQWRPALLLTYNWGAIEAVAAARLMRICPVIHTEDGFGDEEATRQMPRRVLTRRLVLRHATRVIAISENLESIMRNVWRLPDRVVEYIPNGVDVGLYLPPNPPRTQGADLIVGTAGQLRPEKRQEDLVGLCAQLQQHVPVRLRIAGDGPERPKLERYANESAIRDRVEFLGQIKDLRSFYSGLDLFALTSSTEQMPMTVLEAMASGLAVISTDVGDVKRMVSEENVSFIIPAGAQLVRAAKRLALDEPLRRSLGALNRRKCEENYSLEKMIDTYHNLYMDAVQGSA
jgi:glycosyltransferase involved in cell wall biosynthesis